MPNINGFELYGNKKERREGQVCFLTAFKHYYDKFKKIFPKLDARCFTNKPISTYGLAKRIKEDWIIEIQVCYRY